MFDPEEQIRYGRIAVADRDLPTRRHSTDVGHARWDDLIGEPLLLAKIPFDPRIRTDRAKAAWQRCAAHKTKMLRSLLLILLVGATQAQRGLLRAHFMPYILDTVEAQQNEWVLSSGGGDSGITEEVKDSDQPCCVCIRAPCDCACPPEGEVPEPPPPELCPERQFNLLCTTDVRPVICNQGLTECIYNNKCEAEDSDWDMSLCEDYEFPPPPQEDDCPRMRPGMACIEIFQPVVCNGCPYPNSCFAGAAGFSEGDCVSVAEEPPLIPPGHCECVGESCNCNANPSPSVSPTGCVCSGMSCNCDFAHPEPNHCVCNEDGSDCNCSYTSCAMPMIDPLCLPEAGVSFLCGSCLYVTSCDAESAGIDLSTCQKVDPPAELPQGPQDGSQCVCNADGSMCQCYPTCDCPLDDPECACDGSVKTGQECECSLFGVSFACDCDTAAPRPFPTGLDADGCYLFDPAVTCLVQPSDISLTCTTPAGVECQLGNLCLAYAANWMVEEECVCNCPENEECDCFAPIEEEPGFPLPEPEPREPVIGDDGCYLPDPAATCLVSPDDIPLTCTTPVGVVCELGNYCLASISAWVVEEECVCNCPEDDPDCSCFPMIGPPLLEPDRGEGINSVDGCPVAGPAISCLVGEADIGLSCIRLDGEICPYNNYCLAWAAGWNPEEECTCECPESEEDLDCSCFPEFPVEEFPCDCDDPDECDCFPIPSESECNCDELGNCSCEGETETETGGGGTEHCVCPFDDPFCDCGPIPKPPSFCPPTNPYIRCASSLFAYICDGECYYGSYCEANGAGYFDPDTDCTPVPVDTPTDGFNPLNLPVEIDEDDGCPRISPSWSCFRENRPMVCSHDATPSCEYPGPCAAAGAGFKVARDCVDKTAIVSCPLPANTPCTLEFQPVKCSSPTGPNGCPYPNKCVAAAAGFLEEECVLE